MKILGKDFAIYLSGPMRGVAEFNKPAFDAAAEALRAKGYTVFSPPENEIPTEEELLARDTSRQRRQMYLSRDIDIIQESVDAVVLLPGWEDSEGAKLEVAVAQAIGVPVFRLTEDGPILLHQKVVMNVE